MYAAALQVGRTLLTKVGLNGATLSKAGAWLKSALWGSNLSKATTVLSAGSLLKTTAATGSQAAQQVRRHG